MVDIKATIASAKHILSSVEDDLAQGPSYDRHTNEALAGMTTLLGALITVIGDQQEQIERLRSSLNGGCSSLPAAEIPTPEEYAAAVADLVL